MVTDLLTRYEKLRINYSKEIPHEAWMLTRLNALELLNPSDEALACLLSMMKTFSGPTYLNRESNLLYLLKLNRSVYDWWQSLVLDANEKEKMALADFKSLVRLQLCLLMDIPLTSDDQAINAKHNQLNKGVSFFTDKKSTVDKKALYANVLTLPQVRNLKELFDQTISPLLDWASKHFLDSINVLGLVCKHLTEAERMVINYAIEQYLSLKPTIRTMLFCKTEIQLIATLDESRNQFHFGATPQTKMLQIDKLPYDRIYHIRDGKPISDKEVSTLNVDGYVDGNLDELLRGRFILVPVVHSDFTL